MIANKIILTKEVTTGAGRKWDQTITYKLPFDGTYNTSQKRLNQISSDYRGFVANKESVTTMTTDVDTKEIIKKR